MDLTFQIPIEYYSLQRRTLLPSSVTCTTGCCFCFGSISSFFLELFLHSSPVAYWVHTDLGSSFSLSYISAFHTVQGVLKARILKWFIVVYQIDYILCNQRWRNSIQSAKTRPGADCGSDHELLIAKFRFKLKKVGKTTRPFRYDLSQIPYNYTVEVTNRFKYLENSLRHILMLKAIFDLSFYFPEFPTECPTYSSIVDIYILAE